MQYSGIYQGYEGTTADCNTVQRVRETVYDTDSGLLRYKTAGGDLIYFDTQLDGTSGYIPMFNDIGIKNSIISMSSTDMLVHLAPYVTNTFNVTGYDENYIFSISSAAVDYPIELKAGASF